MSLRFFGRQKAPPEQTVSSPEQSPPEPARRSSGQRRGARGRRWRAEQPREAVVSSPLGPPAAAPEAPPRGRRRRRSPAGEAVEAKIAPPPAPEPPVAETPARGRRRRRAAAREERRAEPEPPAAPPPAVDLSRLETLLAQQGALLEAFARAQAETLRGVERSLSAVERGREAERGEGRLCRVGIFVDVPNVMYAAERQRLTIDFGRLLEYLSRGRELVRASAYAPISDDPQAKIETQKFVQPFMGLGYRIVTKPLKRYTNGSIKANFDVELAIDVLSMSDRLDVVVLVSGDGDFRRLVELVASKGVRVEVVAFAQSTASELRAVADEYVDIGEHLDEFQVKKAGGRRRTRATG